jgi:hypothetical protein
MLSALCLVGDDRLADAFAAAMAKAKPGLEAFNAMGRAYVRFALANPSLFRLMMSAQPGGVDHGKSRGRDMLARTRCGGTDFKAASEHANKNKHRFDGYLILTDGECDDPGPSGLKRGWVIVPDRKLLFTPSTRDFIIKMKHESTVGVTKAA